MKNATVTIDYESFQRLKEQADKYNQAKQNQTAATEKEHKFVERICNCIELANDAPVLEQKQHYIAQGIRAICEHYDMDLQVEYGELDEGQASEG